MKLEEIQAAEARLLLPTYDRVPINFVSGDGVYLVDDRGERYLDLVSGIGVNALGYGHPAILETIARQSRKLIHISNLYFHEYQAELARRLTEMTGLDRVFFGNSGTESMEAALKLARAHAGLLRSEGRHIGSRFLALEHSFHGRSMGALATTHKEKYRTPFEPLTPGVTFVPANDVASLEQHFSEDYCAVLIEAIQGEGGIRPLTRPFLEAARALTHSTGALLIADEIQSGMGRTGRWCAYQHSGIQPDITTLAKPLAGGLPMGATIASDEAARAIHPGLHGTTFGGGPLACSVAIAVIDTIEREHLLDHIREIGTYFRQKLEGLAGQFSETAGGAGSVRGMGLMLALELNSAEAAKQVVGKMLDRHILINRTSDTVLRFLPPYILGKSHVDEAVGALSDCLIEAVTVHA